MKETPISRPSHRTSRRTARLRAALSAGLPAVLVALAPVALAPATPAWAAPVPDSCAGVWVVIDPGTLGPAPTISCATSHASGTDALASAGVSVARKGNGMVCQLNDLPSACVTSATAYWSYWHATRRPDGGYSDWTYSSLGADGFHPGVGDVEGWWFGDGTTGPTVAPDATGTAGVAFPATPPPVDGPAGAVITVIVLAGVAGALVAWRVRGRRR